MNTTYNFSETAEDMHSGADQDFELADANAALMAEDETAWQDQLSMVAVIDCSDESPAEDERGMFERR
jgi:hypothetical protein